MREKGKIFEHVLCIRQMQGVSMKGYNNKFVFLA